MSWSNIFNWNAAQTRGKHRNNPNTQKAILEIAEAELKDRENQRLSKEFWGF